MDILNEPLEVRGEWLLEIAPSYYDVRTGMEFHGGSMATVKQKKLAQFCMVFESINADNAI